MINTPLYPIILYDSPTLANRYSLKLSADTLCVVIYMNIGWGRGVFSFNQSKYILGDRSKIHHHEKYGQ